MRQIMWLAMLCIVATSALAFGISPPSYEIQQDAVEDSYEVRVLGDAKAFDASVILTGELAPYIIPETDVITIEPEGTVFRYSLDLPEKLSPGKHKGIVIFEQIIPEGQGGNFNVKSAIGHVVKVFATSDQKYAEINLITNSIQVGQDVNFVIEVRNLGGQHILSANATIDIYDQNDELIETLKTREGAYFKGMSGQLSTEWDADSFSPGRYSAVAKLNYDGIETTDSTDFRIGEILVEAKRINPVELNKSGIEILEIDLENYWSEMQTNVFAEVTIDSNTFRTAPTNVREFGTAKLTAYVDTGKLTAGNKTVDVKVYFSGRESREEFNLLIVEPKNYQMFYFIGGALLVLVLLLWQLKRRH